MKGQHPRYIWTSYSKAYSSCLNNLRRSSSFYNMLATSNRRYVSDVSNVRSGRPHATSVNYQNRLYARVLQNGCGDPGVFSIRTDSNRRN